MAFDVNWDSNGVGFNGAGVTIRGPNDRYVIRWGDGTTDANVRFNQDDDNDGTPDRASVFHSFPSDGTYDILVSEFGAGLPPEHLRAFLYSSATSDLTIGGTGLDDMIHAGTGNDTLSGGLGDDYIVGYDGNDRLSGGDGDDVLLADGGSDTARGGEGSDLIGGGDGNDILQGDGGNDYIYGDSGADSLIGGDGDDYLQGGAGADRLTGGAGADLFVFAPPPQQSSADGLRGPDAISGPSTPFDPDRDRVLDWQQDTDHFSVGQWFGGNSYSVINATHFDNAGPEIRFVFNGGNTYVFGDVDGDKSVDFSFIVNGVYQLSNTDFVG